MNRQVDQRLTETGNGGRSTSSTIPYRMRGHAKRLCNDHFSSTTYRDWMLEKGNLSPDSSAYYVSLCLACLVHPKEGNLGLWALAPAWHDNFRDCTYTSASGTTNNIAIGIIDWKPTLSIRLLSALLQTACRLPLFELSTDTFHVRLTMTPTGDLRGIGASFRLSCWAIRNAIARRRNTRNEASNLYQR
jgi:hypothetical protein